MEIHVCVLGDIRLYIYITNNRSNWSITLMFIFLNNSKIITLNRIQDSRNGYLPHPCACLVWRRPRGEPTPVSFLACSKVPRCELLALTGLPRVLLFKMYNEKCRLLIDLYKDHRSLWDPKHKNYHNSTRREDFAVSFYSSKSYVSQQKTLQQEH
jgi:hypothetical protein